MNLTATVSFNVVGLRNIHHSLISRLQLVARKSSNPTTRRAQVHRNLSSSAPSTVQSPQDQRDNDVTASSPLPTLVKVATIPAPHTGHIQVITLNSPRNKNAISRQLLAELESALREIQMKTTEEALAWRHRRSGAALGQNTRAIVLGSEVDGIFCAGADLKERKEMTRQETDEFLTCLRRTFTMLHRFKIPSISAISSVAFGGGLELGLATHFRVFSPATIVALPETRLGIVPGAGGTYRLKSLLGTTRALDLILTGRRVQGEEAFRIGLCDRLVGPSLEDIQNDGIKDDDVRQHVMQGAVNMATEICGGGPATTKSVMSMTRTGRQEVETKEYDKVIATEDRDEALRAFAEKRKPVFKGK
ncbi:MAG: hypothetical protein Q9209_006559 [Squamulea sp. 1 TL-2023]